MHSSHRNDTLLLMFMIPSNRGISYHPKALQIWHQEWSMRVTPICCHIYILNRKAKYVDSAARLYYRLDSSPGIWSCDINFLPLLCPFGSGDRQPKQKLKKQFLKTKKDEWQDEKGSFIKIDGDEWGGSAREVVLSRVCYPFQNWAEG